MDAKFLFGIGLTVAGSASGLYVAVKEMTPRMKSFVETVAAVLLVSGITIALMGGIELVVGNANVSPPVASEAKAPGSAAVSGDNNQVHAEENKDSSVNIEQTNPHNSPPIVGDGNKVTINPEANPNASAVTYEYSGQKRIWSAATGTMTIEDGEVEAFKKMAEMEREGNWAALRDLCEEETKKVPDWLTPAAFAGKAYALLGEMDKAIEQLDYVHQKAAGRKDYEAVDRLREQLRQKTGM
jgi:hypothetical protein